MNNKRTMITIITILVLIIILILWSSGIIPKMIAIIYSTHYFEKNFPKINMEYESIEWAPPYGDYIIKFKDNDNKTYGFCIGPKYFPIKIGQGIFGFEEEYREKYEGGITKENNANDNVTNINIESAFINDV